MSKRSPDLTVQKARESLEKYLANELYHDTPVVTVHSEILTVLEVLLTPAEAKWILDYNTFSSYWRPLYDKLARIADRRDGE